MKKLSTRDKRFWRNLTKRERAEFMTMQMSSRRGSNIGGGGYYPEDCSDCSCCGEPMCGAGWCQRCLNRWGELYTKGQGLSKTEAA